MLGHPRQVEHPGAQGPGSLIPFRRRSVGVAPGVGRIVEAARVDDRPVQEVVLRIVGIFIGVEHVADAHLADRDDDAVGGLFARELVHVRIDLLGLAAEIDGLAHNDAVDLRIGRALADLGALRVGEGVDAEGVAEAKALVELGVDPEFGALPQPCAEVGGDVGRLVAPLARVQALRPDVRRAETRMVLIHKRGLAVQGEGVALSAAEDGVGIVGERWAHNDPADADNQHQNQGLHAAFIVTRYRQTQSFPVDSAIAVVHDRPVAGHVHQTDAWSKSNLLNIGNIRCLFAVLATASVTVSRRYCLISR